MSPDGIPGTERPRIALGLAMLAGAVLAVASAWAIPRAFQGSHPSANTGRVLGIVYVWLVAAALAVLGALNVTGRAPGRKMLVASLVLLLVGTPSVVAVWAVNCFFKC